MPRLQPAPGYITAKTATEMLGISDGMLSQYVRSRKLKRYGPPERKQKFYKLSEVEALIASRQTFDEYQETRSAQFIPATLKDIPAIVDIDERTFNAGQKDAEPREEYLKWIEETYRRWFKRNPDAFFTLKSVTNKLVGYAIFLPFKKSIIDQFVRDEIKMENIPSNDIDLFEPGKPLHVYVIALCVDPVFKSAVKHNFGRRLISGLFSYIYDFAREGIEIQTITARSYTADGKRLMREMGMAHLRSPVPGKELFSINVSESGYPVLIRYSDLLTEWKLKHQEEDK